MTPKSLTEWLAEAPTIIRPCLQKIATAEATANAARIRQERMVELLQQLGVKLEDLTQRVDELEGKSEQHDRHDFAAAMSRALQQTVFPGAPGIHHNDSVEST